MKGKAELKRRLSAAVKPVERMTVAEWSNRYLKLPGDAAEPGQYRTARTPYVEEIMNAFTAAGVKKIVFKSASQVGKSQMLLGIVGRFAQLDPCNIMILQPTLEAAQDFSKSRLERMIRDSKELTPLFEEFGKARNAKQTILNKFYAGGRIVLQGANSPAGLASRPIRILLCDEVDRYPVSAGVEGDPISLAEKRQSSYWNAKTALFSTPTVEGESRIDAEYLLGTQEEWRHGCPNCGTFYTLKFEDMVSEYEERQGTKHNRTVIVNAVRWRCPACGFEYEEAAMKAAEQRYFAENPEAMKNGVRSFFVNGFASPWVSWRTIMSEYLTAKGNPARQAVVYNTRFGRSYKQTGEYTDEEEFLRRREAYAAEVPAGVRVLTAAVDVQFNRLEFLICGFGIEEEFWGIRRGLIRGSPQDAGTWQQLDLILDKEYKYQNGAGLKVARTFIDSGYSTRAVYNYCRLNQFKGRCAIKGTGIIGAPIIYKYAYPKGYSIVLTIIGVNDGKQEVFSRLGITTPGAMYLHFPENPACGFDETFFKQLISERRVVKRSGGMLYSAFEPVKSKARNEALDLMTYNLAAIKSFNITEWNSIPQGTGEVKTRARKPVSRSIDIFGGL